MTFVFPAPWRELVLDSTHKIGVQTTQRGNLAVAIDLTAEDETVAGQEEVRRRATYITPTGGAPPMVFGESLAVQKRRIEYLLAHGQANPEELPLQTRSPRLMNVGAGGLEVTERVTPRQEPRYRVFLISREAVEVFRRYLNDVGMRRVGQVEILNAAGLSIYTAKLGGLPTGFKVRVTPEGRLEHVYAQDLPDQGIRGSAYNPMTYPRNEPFSGRVAPELAPVTYETVSALIAYVQGPLRLNRENFANELGYDSYHQLGAAWVRSGYIPGSKIPTWMPPPGSLPRPPVVSPQKRLEGGAPPPFPSRPRRPSGRAPPPRYRTL